MGKFKLVVLFLLLGSTDILAQQFEPVQSVEAAKKYLQSNTSYPGEKVYLHLDRPSYMQGDTIWFKAYSWFGYDQKPDTFSRVLYVDLLNPKGEVELKRKLFIENGASAGDFSLDKNISPGSYTLRAYTRWMQNENTGEPFYQTVAINAVNENVQVDCSSRIIKQADGDSLKAVLRFYEINSNGELKNDFSHRVNYSIKIGDRRQETGETVNATEHEFECPLPEIGEKDSVAELSLSIKDEKLTFEKQFRIPLKEEIDFQFFPEGGNLINGIESKVAFKAIGTDGLSREINGVIKDKAGEVVTGFASLHKGMGSFSFTPEAKKEYFAFFVYHNREFRFPLPKALEDGIVMAIDYKGTDSIPDLTVKYSPSKANAQKYVVVSSYGKIRFVEEVKTMEDSCRVTIPVEQCPEGVTRITVLDSGFKPEGERLIYIDRNQRFKIEIKADSSSYGTRSKVTLSVKTKGLDRKAVSANLSVAVVDKEQIIKDGRATSISAYKLLQSELKGNIEDADFYFKDDSCLNRQALDLLLLTQGYRRFVSGKENSGELKFKPERGLDIIGKVALRGAAGKGFDYSQLGLTLLCSSQNAFFGQSRPDGLGNFCFHIPFQQGRPLALLKAFRPTGRLSNENIPREKTFRGDIFIDDVETPTLFELPAPSPVITVPAIDYIHQLQEIIKNEISKTTNGAKWQLNLPEVTVKGKDKSWYTRFEDEAKKVVDMDSLDPTGKKYENIYDLLVRKFGAHKFRLPGLETVMLPANNWRLTEYLPIYVLDGQQYCDGWEGSANALFGKLNNLSSIRVNEIKKIMVLPPGNISHHYANWYLLNNMGVAQSTVVIETYTKNTFRGDPDGIKTFIIQGLDTQRKFYSPHYDGPNKNNPDYDGRATLYWNPDVKTDDKGQTKVEFYTGDRRTEMEVIVNGMEIGSGNPGQGKRLISSTGKN